MPWIRTIDPEDADGRLAELYAWQAAKLGRPTEFTRLGSLDPEIVNARLVLYRASENIASALTADQRSMISYLTSILNSTPHCASLARTQLANADEDDLIGILDRGDYGRLDPLLPSKSLLNYCDALSGIKENSVAGRDHRTKAHFAVGDALVSFGDLVERVGLGHYFDFSRCGDL